MEAKHSATEWGREGGKTRQKDGWPVIGLRKRLIPPPQQTCLQPGGEHAIIEFYQAAPAPWNMPTHEVRTQEKLLVSPSYSVSPKNLHLLDVRITYSSQNHGRLVRHGCSGLWNLEEYKFCTGEGRGTHFREPRKLDAADKGSEVWRGRAQQAEESKGGCFGIPNYQIGRQKRRAAG